MTFINVAATDNMAGVWIAIFGLSLVLLAVQIFICYLLQTCYSRIPEDFRQLSPGLV